VRVIRYIVRRDERFVFNRLAIIPVLAVLFLAARDGGQFVALSIAAFDDPVFFHGRFHASVAPLDSRFKIPDATMEELSFRARTSCTVHKYSRIIGLSSVRRMHFVLATSITSSITRDSLFR